MLASRTRTLTNHDEVERGDAEKNGVSLLVSRSVARLVDYNVFWESAWEEDEEDEVKHGRDALLAPMMLDVCTAML